MRPPVACPSRKLVDAEIIALLGWPRSPGKRHGTLCLIANFDVVTGKAIVPTVGPTRGEDYFNAVLAKPFKWTYAGKALCV